MSTCGDGAGADGNNPPNNIPVTFNSVTGNGSPTGSLTLTFSAAITGLSAGDISLSGVSGVTKGMLTGSGPVYNLGISSAGSGNLSVAVSKTGYSISGSPRTVVITGSGGDSVSRGRIVYSYDGLNWTNVESNSFTGVIHKVVYGKGMFVAIGGDTASYGNAPKILISYDGISWTVTEESIFGKEGVQDIAYGNNRFVAVGGNTVMSGGRGRIAYSADGITWKEIEEENTTFGASRNIYDVAWGGDRFIAVGDSDSSWNKSAISTDGMTWTKGSKFPGSNGTIENIAWGNDIWVTESGWIDFSYSTDSGATWKSVIAGMPTSAILDIGWGKDKFIAVGQNGMMMYSVDGTAWTKVTNSIITGMYLLRNVIWGSDKFIATGGDFGSGGLTNNRMVTSADGQNWSTVTNSGLSSEFVIYDIAWGNGIWVAVGYGK